MSDRRRAVVTGGEGVLGAAIAAALRDTGWDVLAPGRHELNVADPANVDPYFDDVGPVDLLVNNAGITRDAAAQRLTEVEWDAVMATNLRGAFLCARAAIKHREGRNGRHIVQIGSFSAVRGNVGQANYAAAKAGLIGLTKSLAQEYGKAGVRSNCILPGFLEHTGMTAALSAEIIEAAREMHCLKRFNTPASVGRFIVALHELDAVSGQVFQLDSRISA